MFRFSSRTLAVSACVTLKLASWNNRSNCDTFQNTAVNFIIKSVTENQIVIFSKTRCRYCVIAKKILDSMSLKYFVVELDVSDVVLNYMMIIDGQVIENGGYIGQEISRMTGMNTIPIIFVNGKLVGGCDSLQACIENGSFQEELKRSQ